MNDFLARNSNIQSSRPMERAGRPVAEAQAGQMFSQRDGKRAGQASHLTDIDAQLSSAAEVADAQAKIAALLSEVDGLADAAAIDFDALEAKIATLLPRPTIIVPMPPASRDVVERAIEMAETIRASAILAIAAQGNLERGMTEALLD